MKQELYSAFLSKTNNKFISELLAKLLYLIYVVRYWIKSIAVKKHNIDCIDNARDIISEIYPKPDYVIDIESVTADRNIDVSIIMPIYNYKDVISDCIESVLSQKTKYRYELILVDDGSTDGASEIVDGYATNENVKVIHQKNTGIGGARNTGLNNAQGKYIMFVDCDDFVHDNYIEVLLDQAYKTDDDVVICGYTLVKKREGRVLSKRDIIYSPKNLMFYKESEDRIMNFQGLPWNKVFKRELFDNVRYIKGFWYEDTIIHFLVFTQCKSYSYVEKSLYDYMWYEKNFSHTQGAASPKNLERYWMMEVMSDEYDRIGMNKGQEFYKVLLRHLGDVYYDGIKNFDENVRNAAFSLASDILLKYKPKVRFHLTYMERQLENSLINRDINKWELVCTSL